MPNRSSARGQAAAGKTWQQTKSELTRTAILDAALRCFHDLGYKGTTTERVATLADVSRGAMLHHFPTRISLIRSAIGHLNAKRLQAYEAEEGQVQHDARYSRIEEGLDKYWEQLESWLFVVQLELQVAARTDHELRDVLYPAIEEYEAASLESTRRLFPDLALSERFRLAVSLSRYLMEGMAINKITRDPDRDPTVERDAIFAYLKTQLRAMFSDVHERVDRETAAAQRRDA